MSSRRSRSGRQGQRHHAQPVVEVVAEGARVHRAAQVEAGGGHEAHVHLERPRPAQRARTCCSSTTRRSLACRAEAQVLDLVEEHACRPAAISILPALAWLASVKAPASWPKSSDSSSSSGIDGQCTLMSGPSRRGPLVVQPVGEQVLARAALALDRTGRLASARRAATSSSSRMAAETATTAGQLGDAASASPGDLQARGAAPQPLEVVEDAHARA